MKLLLDEMVPTALAEQLRARGHDVAAEAPNASFFLGAHED